MTAVRRAILCAFAAAIGSAAPLTAQTIRGVVVDDSTKRPIEGAAVTLLDDKGVDLLRPAVRTDTAGRFVLHAGKQDTYRVKAIRIGYQPVMSGTIKLTEAQMVTLQLQMTVQPQRITAIQVTEKRRLSLAELMSPTGYDLRRSKNVGKFLDSATLAQYGRAPVRSALDDRHTSFGLQLSRDSREGSEVLQIMNGLTPCYPEVYLDGTWISAPMGIGQAGAVNGSANALARLNILGADQVYGVEVYRRNQIPPPSLAGEFGTNSKMNAKACGVIAVWTTAFAKRAAVALNKPPG